MLPNVHAEWWLTYTKAKAAFNADLAADKLARLDCKC